MQPWLRVLALLIALAVWPTSTIEAQDWNQPWFDPMDRPPRVDLSAIGGFLVPTDWSDLVLLGSISSATGVFEQVLVRDVRAEPGASWGGAVTYWRGNYGVRAQGEFSRSSLRIGSAALAPPGQPLSITMNTWLYDVRGIVGLGDYRPTRVAWPYAFVGVGGITYDLADTVSPPLLTFIEGGRRIGENGDIVILDGGREFLLAIDELGLETVPSLNFGVGTDLRIPLGPGAVALRLEVSDHVARSPVQIEIRELSSFGVDARPLRFGFVHHLRAAAGLVVQVGR